MTADLHQMERWLIDFLEKSRGLGANGSRLLAMLYRMAPRPRGSVRFSITVYAVDFLLPLGFCVLNGYWIAVLVGLGGVAAASLLLGWRRAVDDLPAAPTGLPAETRLS
jgi:hypothetical protein